MKLYIAASFSNREAAIALRTYLHRAGHQVVARWLDTHLTELDALDPARKGHEALEDLEDIDQAEAVVFLNSPEKPSTSGGQHLEMGYALAQGKTVYLVGPRTSVFHYHPLVRKLWVDPTRCGYGPTQEALDSIGLGESADRTPPSSPS